jgi:hypothetical protein
MMSSTDQRLAHSRGLPDSSSKAGLVGAYSNLGKIAGAFAGHAIVPSSLPFVHLAH